VTEKGRKKRATIAESDKRAVRGSSKTRRKKGENGKKQRYAHFTAEKRDNNKEGDRVLMHL